MFSLSALLAASASAPGVLSQRPSWAGREYSFPVQGVRGVRLPGQLDRLDALFGGPRDSAIAATLDGPQLRVPLDGPPDRRRFGLLLGFEGDESEFFVVQITLEVRFGETRFDAGELVDASVVIADEQESQGLMETLWLGADPRARAGFVGVPAIWLGGVGLAKADTDLIGAIGASAGLSMEVVREPARHVREVATRIKSAPPGTLAYWRHGSFGAESLLAAFESVSAEGDVITLEEAPFTDALIELRLELADRGYFTHETQAGVSDDSNLPKGGEERCYIKTGGSAVGDIMVEVADCGHEQWGSDVRRLAPRAYKGISRGIAMPTRLFRCARCSKHRWKARF